MVKANQTCFDLVQLAEEITEELQCLQRRTTNTFYILVVKINQSGPKLKNSIINLITNAIKYSGYFKYRF
jgi:signal transduction histidine kinase